MDKVCTLYYKACIKYGLTPIINDNMGGFFIELGHQRYAFRCSHVPFNDPGSATISSNKYCTNKMLEENGLPVPRADAVSKAHPEEVHEAIAELKFPLVVKPTWDTSCGDDVICGIKDLQTLNTVLGDLYNRYNYISVEEFKAGLRSYRVLVLHNKVIAVAERIPAHVIGDGMHNIQQLIDLKNIVREKYHDILPLGKIQIMLETSFIFDDLGITKEYVPQLDEKIPLRYICNSTYGGSIVGLELKTICKENRELFVKAANILNLDYVGFDFLCTDISIPYTQSKGCIIEANSSPDISIHETVIAGTPTIVSEKVVKRFIRDHFFAYLWYRANHGYASIIIRFFIFLALALGGYYALA